MKMLTPPPSSKVEVAGHSATELSSLLLDLEQSLRDTQCAVLKHDLAGLQRLTQTQQRISSSFLALPFHELQTAGLSAVIAARLLQLGRIQIALLARAQSSLRMISNLLAGVGSDYSGLTRDRRTLAHQGARDQGGV
jgi:hypothetical protein